MGGYYLIPTHLHYFIITRLILYFSQHRNIIMDTTLYDTLGLTKDASQEDIKTAYKKLAMQHHPDRNKDDDTAEAKFVKIKHAYEILSNPELRLKYDETGDIPNDAIDPLRNDVINIFVEVISVLPNPSQHDIIQAMLNNVHQKQAAFANTSMQLVSKINEFRKVIPKIHLKDDTTGDNMFVTVLESNIAQMEKQLSDVNSMLKRGLNLIEFINKYTFDVDTAANSAFKMTSVTSFLRL
jgi:hypothetical protein